MKIVTIIMEMLREACIIYDTFCGGGQDIYPRSSKNKGSVERRFLVREW